MKIETQRVWTITLDTHDFPIFLALLNLVATAEEASIPVKHMAQDLITEFV